MTIMFKTKMELASAELANKYKTLVGTNIGTCTITGVAHIRMQNTIDLREIEDAPFTAFVESVDGCEVTLLLQPFYANKGR